MPLTDAQIRRAKPGEADYRLPDGQGLHLFVTTAGGKHWRLRYRFGGKEKLLSIGPYPAISLAEAREVREAAKSALRQGKDPGELKKRRRLTAQTDAATTFETVAREWHELQKPVWSDTHADDVIRSLEIDVFPEIGSIPLREITAPDVLDLLNKVTKRGAKEKPRRIRQRISAVFVYGIATRRADTDPAAIITGALPKFTQGRQPAVIDLDQARQIIKDVDAIPARPITKLALRLLALTVVRPGTLIATPWAEMADLDADQPTWTIPPARMKLAARYKLDEARAHLVPLPRQAIETVDALRVLTGRTPYLFPNGRRAHSPMSENAIGYLLNRAGYHQRHVPHGWRATFSTIMNERFRDDRQIIDLMLAHVPKDRVEGAYNRAEHLDRRRELAQIWADLLMKGQAAPSDLIAGRRR